MITIKQSTSHREYARMPTRVDLSDVDRSDWAVPIDNRGQGDGGRGSGLIARGVCVQARILRALHAAPYQTS